MKLTVLVDNNTFIDHYYLGEPALSFYLENEPMCILFDTGYSDAFLKNAQKMKGRIDVDKVVISHGHNDHTGGLYDLLRRLPGRKVIAHPDAFYPKADENHLDIGSPLRLNQIKKYCDLYLSKDPVWVDENLIFLGEIPELVPFEPRYAIGTKEVDGKVEEDYIKDDSALVYQTEQGLFVITGCSHSGICNIVEYAKKVCNDNRILGIIGGFHLMQMDERTERTIEYLKQERIPYLYPCHCVSLPVKIQMGAELDIREVGVGLQLDIAESGEVKEVIL